MMGVPSWGAPRGWKCWEPRPVLQSLAGARPSRWMAGEGRQAAVGALHLDRVLRGEGGQLAGEPHVPGLDPLGQREGDQQCRAGGHDRQQRGTPGVGLERHARAAIDRHGHGGDPPGGHQAASLATGRLAGLMPVARSENAIRALHLPLPWQRPESTYGVTWRPSNSTISNGVRVGGTGILSARIFTTISRDRPSSSGSMSITRHWNTGWPVYLSTEGDRRLVASS